MENISSRYARGYILAEYFIYESPMQVLAFFYVAASIAKHSQYPLPM